MRSRFAKALRSAFADSLGQAWPEFTSFPGAEVPDTITVFRRGACGGACFVSLQLHRSGDSFTVEVAWTSDGSYPALAPLADPPSLSSIPDTARFRLPELWLGAGADHWWELNLPSTATADMLTARVQLLLADALVRLQADGAPMIAAAEKKLCGEHLFLPMPARVP